MMACVILRNMIVEDERTNNEVENFKYEQFNDTQGYKWLQWVHSTLSFY
jgi:hypothetical protein